MLLRVVFVGMRRCEIFGLKVAVAAECLVKTKPAGEAGFEEWRDFS